jgi:hypothetical protein
VSALADQLLDAHVAHELSRLTDDGLSALVDEKVTAAFAWMDDATVNDVVTPEQILGVIRRYVIDFKVSGGITELAGQMSNVVFSSQANATTRVSEVCDPTSYADFADKVVGLKDVRRELIRSVLGSPAFGTLVSRVLSSTVVDLLFRTDDGRSGSRMKELLRVFGDRVLPGFEGLLQSVLTRYVDAHAGRFLKDSGEQLLLALDPEWVRQMADEIWDAVADQSLVDAVSAFTARDLEDFVVLGYEFWLKFRKTAYFRAVSTDVVNEWFRKYGGDSLHAVVQDMGITERMVSDELRIFLGPIVDHAFRTGALAQQIRAHLEPFYRSAAAESVFAEWASSRRST